MMCILLAEVANEVLSKCVSCREVNGREFKMIYEVDYLFLEEYKFHPDEEEDDDDNISQYKDEEDPEQGVADESLSKST